MSIQEFKNKAFQNNEVKKEYEKFKYSWEILGFNHQDTANSYNNLAIFYKNIKQDYDKAEDYYMKSLTIYENVLGFNH